VHFDAHLDTWQTYFGAPHARHAVPARRGRRAIPRRAQHAHRHPRAAVRSYRPDRGC
jgi:arginase family enzyme